MKFCIFDVIIDNGQLQMQDAEMLWIDEILYLWCDYRQRTTLYGEVVVSCELMKFCIFDVIIDNQRASDKRVQAVVNWWNFVSLMWL